jgi:hypothetical protein
MIQWMERERRMSSKQPANARRGFRLALVLVAVAVVGLALAMWSAGRALGGKPSLAVDKTAIDLGRVPFDTYTDPAFKITNVGSAPLKIIDKPKVEVAQGC